MSFSGLSPFIAAALSDLPFANLSNLWPFFQFLQYGVVKGVGWAGVGGLTCSV